MLGGATGRAAAVGAAAVLVLAACGLAGGGGRTPGSAGPVPTLAALAAPKQVVVHGREIATRCAGDPAAPSVLLVAGYDTPLGQAWDDVQPQIGTFAHVCAYDRLGVGGSAAAPARQTFAGMAADLDAVLRQLGLKRPVVLVAHSLGGMVAVTWAEVHRRDLAGLVLVDATPPGYAEALLAALPQRGATAGALRRQWQRLLSPQGNAEHLDGEEGFRAALSFSPLGAVPLIALTHSISDLGDGLRPRTAAALDSAWIGGQQVWAELSRRGRVQVVDRAGHVIQRDQPQAVVAAVGRVVDTRAGVG